jgi:hypothetical protein
LFVALTNVYPDHKWDITRFEETIPRSFWNSIENQKEFMDKIAPELNVKKLSDWYKVSLSGILYILLFADYSVDFIAKGGTSLLKHYNNNLVSGRRWFCTK